MSESGELISSFVDRIMKLEDEKDEIKEDIREVCAEAKGAGLQPKIIRQIVRNKRKSAEKVAEEKELLELYESAMLELK